MKNIKLTSKEQKENVFQTLGRLNSSIAQISGDDKKTLRSLALLTKIIDDVSRMDIDLDPSKRETF